MLLIEQMINGFYGNLQYIFKFKVFLFMKSSYKDPLVFLDVMYSSYKELVE
jgi:hypothetical protein